MDLFGKEKKELIDIIDNLSVTVMKQAGAISDIVSSKNQNVRLVLTTSINNSIFIIMSINLSAKQFSIDSLGLVDTDTGLAVVATFANQTFTSDNPAIFTSTQDPANPNQSKDVAIAAGNANLLATADATYTDSKTGLSVTKTGLKVSVPVIISAVVAGENVALVINQGTPQAQ
ncbi:MAG TPA: hypothetical protein VGZ90_13475 [Puia sp.]|jgi:hypothetical protein|nr:hypothetical protein [Puia sp.]